jgi:hypothetical protein
MPIECCNISYLGGEFRKYVDGTSAIFVHYRHGSSFAKGACVATLQPHDIFDEGIVAYTVVADVGIANVYI